MQPQFQSPDHERSYRLACKAVAYARRETYRTVAAATTAELREWERVYRAEVPGPVTGEALTHLRMMRAVVAHRARSRAAQQFRAARRASRS